MLCRKTWFPPPTVKVVMGDRMFVDHVNKLRAGKLILALVTTNLHARLLIAILFSWDMLLSKHEPVDCYVHITLNYYVHYSPSRICQEEKENHLLVNGP